MVFPKFPKLLNIPKFPPFSFSLFLFPIKKKAVVPATSETLNRSCSQYLPRLCRGHIPRRGGGLGVGQTCNCLRSRQVS